MNVGDICNPLVVVAYKEMSVAEAARLMREQHVGCLVVVEDTNEGKAVVGLLTDRDIVLSVVACDLQAQTMTVGDIMSTDLVTVRGDDALADVLHGMRQGGVRRVPVVSARGILQGIVTLDDVLAIMTNELDDLVRAVSREQKRETATRK
jgi:Predicted signal-transduction protein containing cAMP-binding and CBS domains